MKKITYVLGLALASFLFASCGGDEQKEQKTELATPAEQALNDMKAACEKGDLEAATKAKETFVAEAQKLFEANDTTTFNVLEGKYEEAIKVCEEAQAKAYEKAMSELETPTDEE